MHTVRRGILATKISRILVEFVETDLSSYALLNVDSRITLYAKNANLDIGEEEKKYIRGKVR